MVVLQAVVLYLNCVPSLNCMIKFSIVFSSLAVLDPTTLKKGLGKLNAEKHDAMSGTNQIT